MLRRLGQGIQVERVALHRLELGRTAPTPVSNQLARSQTISVPAGEASMICSRLLGVLSFSGTKSVIGKASHEEKQTIWKKSYSKSQTNPVVPALRLMPLRAARSNHPAGGDFSAATSSCSSRWESMSFASETIPTGEMTTAGGIPGCR